MWTVWTMCTKTTTRRVDWFRLSLLTLAAVLCAGPSYAQRDAIDLSLAVVHNSPADVASWPITSRIETLTMSPEGTPNPGVAMQFGARATWPEWIPPGFAGPLQYTIWAGVNINGVWHVSGFVRMWRDRAATGAPILSVGPGCTVNNFACNWAYDGRWGAMAGYQPRAGESMIFFATAGVARGYATVTTVRERTNVVMVQLPANDSGSWTFPNAQTDLLIDTGGSGLWALVDARATALHGADPRSIAVGDLDGNGVDEAVVDFGSQFGVWIRWNAVQWTPLHSATAERLLVANIDANPREDVILSFAQWGVWAFVNGTSWVQLHEIAVDYMASTRTGTLVLNFPGRGIWARRNDGLWVPIHGLNATAFAAGDFDGNGLPDLAVAFPGHGVWVLWATGGWTQINPNDAIRLVVGDLDAVGHDDLVIDFGAAHGIWALRNAALWTPLHGLSSKHMALADLDGNGLDDVVIDFDAAYGVWVLANLAGWVQAFPNTTDAFVAGDFN